MDDARYSTYFDGRTEEVKTQECIQIKGNNQRSKEKDFRSKGTMDKEQCDTIEGLTNR